ncbi:Acetyltransferase (GNAT) family [Clostridium bornimense]|uniref:Acetyltransferase (GNAT) family n=1 Tax=Clostridium bornimense TaxID=1216932 RepID=W6SKJ4_9CLOT|nr:GNAT family N-acetyltransferase [Clostridium bornimense]CDM70395.1 Acetyltransferase (GNAT) family [Clostridium bornimense]
MDIIRKATQEDVKILRKLYRDFILEMSRFDPDDNNLDDEILLWIETALIGEKSTIFVSENHKSINGFVRTQHKERISDTGNEIIYYAKLSDLYVIPDGRRKGIARQLINASINWAKDRKINEMILNVYEKNESARRLYKTFGFKDDCLISNGRIRMKYDLRVCNGEIIINRKC